jgi:hypothetical protein
MMKKLIVGILIAVLNNGLLSAQDTAVAYVGADKTSFFKFNKDKSAHFLLIRDGRRIFNNNAKWFTNGNSNVFLGNQGQDEYTFQFVNTNDEIYFLRVSDNEKIVVMPEIIKIMGAYKLIDSRRYDVFNRYGIQRMTFSSDSTWVEVEMESESKNLEKFTGTSSGPYRYFGNGLRISVEGTVAFIQDFILIGGNEYILLKINWGSEIYYQFYQKEN